MSDFITYEFLENAFLKCIETPRGTSPYGIEYWISNPNSEVSTVSGNLQALFGSEFPTNSVPPQEDYDCIPPGKYVVMIEKAELKQTKAKTGHLIELQMVVVDGQFAKRKVWDRINVDNPNSQCVEIGMRSLAALGIALKLPAIGDTAQLIGGACVAHVKVKDGQNEVRTYSPLDISSGQTPPPAAQQPRPPFQPLQPNPPASQPPAQTPPPASQTAGKPPWVK